MPAESPADRFWTFSLALYDRPGVAPACLSLQDRCGLDVNLLLFCCWTAAEGRALTEAALRTAIAAAEPWQDAVVRPLRAVRRRLKGGMPGLPGAETDALRRQVAALELEAERLQQRLLAAGQPAAGTGAGSAGTAAANLRLYLTLSGVAPGPPERAALTALLTAAFPDADPADLSFGASG